MRKNNSTWNRFFCTFLLTCVIIFMLAGSSQGAALAQGQFTEVKAAGPVVSSQAVEKISPYFSIIQTQFSNGMELSGYVISGRASPPPEYKAERLASIKPLALTGIIPDFPSYSWVFGCSAVSGAMIAGYYDRTLYPNMYTGPTNGGVMPVTDTSWPLWSDGYDSYPNNPLIASHNGVDGRATRGSIDDYWVQYLSNTQDPYITGGWQQHTWGDAIGDYMKTSQSAYGNVDGSTKFYNWTSDPSQLTCQDMIGMGITDDGSVGRKQFYEARGYSVGVCYNQKTDNNGGGFALANFQAEIDAGNPVLLNLEGHSIVGYGYSGSTIYVRDTWDSDPSHTYTMTWGGSYSGMVLLSVSVVHLNPPGGTKLNYLPLMIKAEPVNQAPTDLLLSNTYIQENLPANTVVGDLSSVDPNPGDTFTYSLVSGAGDSGNSAFNIQGNQLRSAIMFDYELQNSYSIRLRTTDQGGLFFDKIFTITIVQQAQNPFLNWNFELGHVNWQEFSTHGWDIITQTFPGTVTPYDGTWASWLGGDFDDVSYIQQQVTVPAGSPYLSYMHWIASQDYCGYDIAGVLVNGSVVETYDLCIDNSTGGWVQHVVNLSAYAGTSVMVQIRVEADDSLNSNLFVDYVTFQATPKSILPPYIPATLDDVNMPKTGSATR